MASTPVKDTEAEARCPFESRRSSSVPQIVTEDFVSYVGDAGLHDGVVVAVSQDGPEAQVQLHGGNGDRFELRFAGVASISQRRAEGMRIYAVAEMTGKPPLRRFVCQGRLKSGPLAPVEKWTTCRLRN